MTRPLTHVRARIVVTMMRAKAPFTSQRDIAVAAGLVDEPVERNSAKLRLAQRAVVRLIKEGLIRQSSTPEKINNSYTLTAPGRTVAALHAAAVSLPRRAEQPAAQAPR
jgi:hypothetical protein